MVDGRFEYSSGNFELRIECGIALDLTVVFYEDFSKLNLENKTSIEPRKKPKINPIFMVRNSSRFHCCVFYDDFSEINLENKTSIKPRKKPKINSIFMVRNSCRFDCCCIYDDVPQTKSENKTSIKPRKKPKINPFFVVSASPGSGRMIMT